MVEIVKGTNSYITLAEADDYFSKSFGTYNWNNKEETEKEGAILHSYKVLEIKKWAGRKTAVAQTQQFPRREIFDRDGEVIGNTVIPQDIIDAQVELAKYILFYNDFTINNSTQNKASYIKDGEGSVAFNNVLPEELPSFVNALISHLFRRDSITSSSVVARRNKISLFDEEVDVTNPNNIQYK